MLALAVRLVCGHCHAAPPTANPADVRRALQLMAGVGSEYQEAFDEQGQIVRPLDIDQTRLLLTEVRELTAHLPVANDPALLNLLDGLTSLIDVRVPPIVVSSYAEAVRRYLIRTTGIHEDLLPPERPSPTRGGTLFRENCSGCHGMTGAGDGPDGVRLGIKPANFTNLAFMRAETPRDAFNVITLGRGQAGMPSWGEALTPQQVWDLISYIWSINRTPETAATGQAIWSTRCAGCHGVNGDASDAHNNGVDQPARSLTGLLEGADHADAEVFDVVTKGRSAVPMPAFGTLLTDDERWAVVAFVRTLSLEGGPGTAPGALTPDHGAELAGVGSILDAALAAHRHGDPAANALATNAYLRFEPLEKLLAEVDEARATALELAFDTFRNALRDPRAGDPDPLGRQLRADIDTAAALLRPESTTGHTAISGWNLLLRLVVVLILLFATAYFAWPHARRLVASEPTSQRNP